MPELEPVPLPPDMNAMERQAQEMIRGMVLECMNDPDALSCAFEVLESIPEELEIPRPRVVFLTAPQCSHCHDERALYQKEIDQGKIQEVDAYSEDGLDIIEKTNVEGTPALLLLDADNNLLGEFFDSTRVPGEDIASTQD